MRVISTIEELNAWLAANPHRMGDLETLLRYPGEKLEQWILSGKKIEIPESRQEEQAVAREMLEVTVRRIARQSGWKSAARHILRVGGQPPLTGAKLASFAAYLRKQLS